ncbi:peptide-methionine (S)-S-oxide reductase [Halobacteria archaeon HArc-gm2]|nr:peptide-methionine (S)-S-oxide reductase [Halobacteria archaeon HArc-gm2]
MIREYDANAPGDGETATATFALGCFWGPDARFGALDGVVRTRVGYAGGTKRDPTYRDLGDHTEAFQVDYDPARVTFTDLLAVAFENHDPRRQTGKRQYQNVVFHASEGQRESIGSFLETARFDADSVETRIERLDRFTLSERYHQKYNLKSRDSLLERFEDAGYDEEAIRESPAAAKLNGVAGGHDLDDEELESLLGSATSV